MFATTATRIVRPTTLGWLGLVFTLVASSPALAQSTAVLGVGGGPDALRAELGEILLDAVVGNPALQASDQRDLNGNEALMLLGCSEANIACMAELASTLDVDRVILATVEETPESTDVTVHYYDALRGLSLLDETFPFNDTGERTQLEMRLAAVVGNRVVLAVTSEPPGVDVYIDDALLGQTPFISLDLAPGQHTLVGRCDGCSPDQRTIEVDRGRYYTEVLRPTGGAMAVREGDGGEDAGGIDLLPTITVAAGGAMLVTGVIFGFLTKATQDDFDQTPSLREAEDLADKGETQALLANVFLVTGAAITATGIILFITGLGEDEVDTSQAARPRATPWAEPSGGGVLLNWTF